MHRFHQYQYKADVIRKLDGWQVLAAALEVRRRDRAAMQAAAQDAAAVAATRTGSITDSGDSTIVVDALAGQIAAFLKLESAEDDAMDVEYTEGTSSQL